MIYAEIIDSSDDETQKEKTPKKRQKREIKVLEKYFQLENTAIEIGVDEAGRGPLFGRVYTAAVILPKDDSFDHSKMKDSKKFHNKQKIEEAAQYIKENAIAWSVTFEDEKVIDEINILQATQKSMHNSILQTMEKNYKKCLTTQEYTLLIDGDYFKFLVKPDYCSRYYPQCIEGGDNKYTSIAAASILAKVERDKYIESLCQEHPHLMEKYSLHTNKGYGAKKHIDGIKEHGITKWHRRSFGICKGFL